MVDATGVGRPIVDLLDRARLHPVRVTITGGDRVSGSSGSYRVPKSDLVGALQVLLQRGCLSLPGDAGDVSSLVDELLAFRLSVSAETAHESYQAGGTAHDDLVVALALASWEATRSQHSSPLTPVVGLSESQVGDDDEDWMWSCGPERGQRQRRYCASRFVGGGGRGVTSLQWAHWRWGRS